MTFRHAGFTGNLIYFLMSLRLKITLYRISVYLFLFAKEKLAVGKIDGDRVA